MTVILSVSEGSLDEVESGVPFASMPPRRWPLQRGRHPERSEAKSKDPVELSLKIPQRDPSTTLGMTAMRTRLFLGIIAVLASAMIAHGAEVIPPKPDRYFNDYAGVVSPGVAERLNTQLAQFERDASDQVIVAVYRKMQSDSSIEDYTRRVAQAWGVGQKDRRNGVVLFVFIDDRKMFIQVGYGLEGALPDVTAFDITERNIKPKFRAGDYEGGLALGVDLICKAIRGEYKGTGRTNAEHKDQHNNPVGLFVFLLFLMVFLFAVRAARKRGGYRYTGLGGPFISGGWGGGGWSSGGSSGGDFGSFSSGGGSFGGGGAGSSW